MQKNILLLTATVQPPVGALHLVRTDLKLRKQDYLGALHFYLDELQKGTFDKIVLIDNSNTPLGFLAELVTSRNLSAFVELISYDGIDYPPEDGRTFGEFKLIDDAYRLSGILKNLAEDDFVWKVTGRYTVRNIGSLVRHRPSSADLYCNARNVPTKYLDLYCISWNGRGYVNFVKDIFSRLSVRNTQQPGEKIFYDILFDASSASDITVTPRFNLTPFITGIRGFTNSGFNEGKDLRKYYLRVLLRNVAPWIWV